METIICVLAIVGVYLFVRLVQTLTGGRDD
jgi:hypothetical protein